MLAMPTTTVIQVKTMAKIRTRLAELREKKGLTRMDIVRLAGLSYPTVSKWETGVLDSVEADTLASLSKILECNVVELIYVVDDDK